MIEVNIYDKDGELSFSTSLEFDPDSGVKGRTIRDNDEVVEVVVTPDE